VSMYVSKHEIKFSVCMSHTDEQDMM